MVTTGFPNNVRFRAGEGIQPIKWSPLVEFVRDQSRDIKIIDVGAGRGDKLLFLYELGFKNIQGIEYCSEMFEPFREQYPQLSMRQGDAQNLKEIESNAYDLVISCHVLEHLPDPKAAIKEAHRILKRGGIFLIGIPNGYHLSDMCVRGIQKLVYGRTDHLQAFSCETISTLINNIGFEIVKTSKTYGSLEFLLDRRLGGAIGMIGRALYTVAKSIYWKECAFDICAVKN